jgi:hypothetical protein
MKGRRIEPAVGLGRPPILAEFHDIFSHVSPSLKVATINLFEHEQRPDRIHSIRIVRSRLCCSR